jgi:predicted Zn-dependent protease
MNISKTFSARVANLKLATIVSAGILLAACGGGNDEQDYKTHLDRAHAYQEQGQFNAALIEYRNAVKKSGGKPEVMVEFADLMNDLGQSKSARDFLEAIDENSNEAYLLELAETYISLGKYTSAENTLEKLSGTTREKQLLKGEMFTKQGKLDEARAVYSGLLSSDANDSDAHLGMARNEALRGKFQEALDSVAQVAQGSDSYAAAQLLKAGIEVNKGDLEGAESTLSGLLSVLPNTDQMLPAKVSTLERLSYVLTRLGRSNEAYIYTKILSEAFPGANEANDAFQSATEDFKAERLDEAKAKLEKIVAEYPAHTRAKQMLGMISYLQGDNEAAAQYLNESVDPETADPMATQVYAATNLRLNEPKKVLEILEPGIKEQTNVQLLAMYGLAAISDKQYKKGENSLLRATELEPDNARMHLALASYYRVEDVADTDKELAALDKAFAVAPTERQVLVDLSAYYVRQNQQDKARSILLDNAKAHGDSFAANFVAGSFVASDVAREGSDLSASNKLLQQALKIAATDQDKGIAQFALGRNALVNKDYKAAKAHFEALIALAPRERRGYLGYYEAVSQLEGKEQGLKSLEDVAKGSENIEPYQALIRVSLSNNNISRAQRAYDLASESIDDVNALAGARAVINYFQALDYLKTGQLDKARETAANSLLAEPGNLRVLAVLAEVEGKSGNLTEAEKLLAQFEGTSAEQGFIVKILNGDLAFAKKDYPAARNFYQDAWDSSKNSGAAEKLHRTLGLLGKSGARSELLAQGYEPYPDNLLAMLFVALEKQGAGEVDEAANVYEALLAKRPDSVAALNNLGWIYFEKNDKRALDLLAHAAELAPTSAAVLDSYGWVLHKFGKTSEGLPYLKKASDLQPENKEIQQHYSEAKNAG